MLCNKKKLKSCNPSGTESNIYSLPVHLRNVVSMLRKHNICDYSSKIVQSSVFSSGITNYYDHVTRPERKAINIAFVLKACAQGECLTFSVNYGIEWKEFVIY